MQVHDSTSLAQKCVQEVITFFSFLSKTYGSGDVSLDVLGTLTIIVLLYTVLSLIKHYCRAEAPNTEFEEAVSVISEALELTSVQISEMRYKLCTEFARARRELELVRQDRKSLENGLREAV
jgi:hypothetical protein